METEYIEIKGLAVFCKIGVPEEERKTAQRLLLDLRLVPLRPFSEMGDDLTATVDYDALSRDAKQFCEASRYHLIETLADALTRRLIGRFPLREAALTVKKFILPDTEYVSVYSVKRRD